MPSIIKNFEVTSSWDERGGEIVPIVAVSMPESDLEELERLQEMGGFASRSDVVRHALQSLLAEHRSLESLEGEVTAVITVMYSDKGKSSGCSKVQHEHGHLLSAVMHAHSNEGGCVDVMVAKGDSGEIRAFLRDLRMQRPVMRVFVNVIGR
ncbi:MAG: CopG family ribbon-helix-helix protein [Candidatus Thorarchaeota archaeon]